MSVPTMKGSTVRVIPAAELQSLEGEWNALCPAVATLPILDCRFFGLLLRHFGTGAERVLLCAVDEEPIIIGIVQRSGPFQWETFQPSQAPVGPWMCRDMKVIENVHASLFSALGLTCLQFGITQMDPALQSRPTDSGKIRTVDHIEIARLDLAGTYDDYWNSRGKNIKQNMRRQRNKLEREQISLEFRVLSGVDEVGPAVDRYCDLEATGWKAKLGTALTRGGVQGRFYSELMREYALRSETRIFELWFNDRLVASDLCLCRGGTLIVLKTTHDESAERMSPSMLLKQETIKYGYATRDFVNIEYYGRLMDWHKRFTDDTRTMYHVNVLRGTTVRYLVGAKARFERLLRPKQKEQEEAPPATT